MTTQQNIGTLFCSLAVVVATGCVHSQVQRLGRMRLGNGTEGKVEVIAQIDRAAFDEVAFVTVEATGIKTEDRRLRHLLRRASLLGCDGIAHIEHRDDNSSSGICVRRREPEVAGNAREVVIRAPAALRHRASVSGVAGIALIKVLDQADRREGDAKAWPLRWYLKNYPASPFKADVEALFVTVASHQGGGSTPDHIRSAPRNP